VELNFAVSFVIAISFSWWLERNWVLAQLEGGLRKFAAWAALGLATMGYAEAFVTLAGPAAQQIGLLDFRYAMGAINLLFVVSKPLSALFALVLIARDLSELSWAQLAYDLAVFLANTLQYQRWLLIIPGVLFDFWYNPGSYAPGGLVLVLLSLLVGWGLAVSTGSVLVKLFPKKTM